MIYEVFGVEKKFSWFGIDFGTTNCAAFSLTGIDTNSLLEIHYGDDEGRPMPSIVAVNKTTGFVITGREAKDRRNSMIDEYEYFYSIKSILDSEKEWIIAGKKWTPVEIAAELFSSLKKRIETDGENIVDEAVVAVPVGFSAIKRDKLRSAARIAGIEISMFVSEPTAAFCSNYIKLKSCKNVAVFDWGGGTLDVAILKIENGNIHELSTEGMNVAGNDIDKKLAEKMHSRFLKNKIPQISFDELDAATKDQLLIKCEKAKCDFSDDEDMITVSINRYGEYGSVRETMDYEYFSLLVEPEVKNALNCLEAAIQKAGLNKENLDCILCVGGSSKLRPLRDKIEIIYGEDLVFYPERVMWDIAKGASVIATRPGMFALNKPIGIILSDGAFFPLFNRGQKIPCKELNLTFATVDGSKDNAREAKFLITDSENADNRTFIENITFSGRGFFDEYIKLSCYIDHNFIFKLLISSNKMHKQVGRVWSYEELKIYYQIESEE